MLELIPWANGNGWTLRLDADTARDVASALIRALGRMAGTATPQSENVVADFGELDIEVTP